MELFEIKQRILNFKDIEFNRFQNWFDKTGCYRINKNAKSSKIRQSVLKLSDKDFDLFWDWYEDLCDERWAEEVENDPIARQCLEFGDMIMSKPDPDKFLVDLLSGKIKKNTGENVVRNKMKEDVQIDQLLTQHALFKIMENEIIPCMCGAYRKVVQNKRPDSLQTHCRNCGSQAPFNIADLIILGGGLLKLAISGSKNTELKPPKVTPDQVYQMIETIQNQEAWTREIEGQNLRMRFKILKGGLSE